MTFRSWHDKSFAVFEIFQITAIKFLKCVEFQATKSPVQETMCGAFLFAENFFGRKLKQNAAKIVSTA